MKNGSELLAPHPLSTNTKKENLTSDESKIRG